MPPKETFQFLHTFCNIRLPQQQLYLKIYFNKDYY